MLNYCPSSASDNLRLSALTKQHRKGFDIMEPKDEFVQMCLLFAAAILRYYGAEVDSALKTQKTSV